MIRDVITEQVRGIDPLDELEADHQAAVLAWIASGADLFRIKKPDLPPKHLVSYFAVVDPHTKKILLQDHMLAELWLPPGGHVDPDEDPTDTVRRECHEELGINAAFLGEPKPHFITVAQTNDKQGSHTDVSLWFLLQADEATPLTLEEARFKSVHWWHLEEVLRTPIEEFDPNLHRFIHKILHLL